jgi:hypothetical protein
MASAPEHDLPARVAAVVRILGPSVALAIALLAAGHIIDGPVVALLGIAAALLGVVAALFDARKELKRRDRRPGRMVRTVVLTVITVVSLVVLGTLLASGDRPDSEVERISGGCSPYVVYAQNRWQPYGAKRMAAPYRDAKQLSPGVAPNELIYVDGWVRSESAQPSNVAPWDSNIWFHLADSSGWVSFAGTRAVPTPPDPTGLDPNGGTPAPTPADCEGGLN